VRQGSDLEPIQIICSQAALLLENCAYAGATQMQMPPLTNGRVGAGLINHPCDCHANKHTAMTLLRTPHLVYYALHSDKPSHIGFNVESNF